MFSYSNTISKNDKALRNHIIPKRRKLSKDSIIFLILLALFGITLIIQQNLYYSTKKNEIVPQFIQYSENQPEHEFKIIKPRFSQEQQLPAIILLNGDYISSRSFNLLKNEFLQNNFVVVLAEIKIYNNETFPILTGILNETENQNFIDPSRIGIMGHSRGAHFAVHFAAINDNKINAVICGNYASFDDFVHMTPYLITPTSHYPRNVLLISDYNDPNPNRPFNEYLYYTSYDLGFQSEVNTLYGAFNTGNARKAFISDGIFSHSSSLYDPTAINEQISWMTQALKNESPIDETSNIRKHIFLGFFYFSLMCVVSFGLVAKIVIYSSINEHKLIAIVQKIRFSYKKRFSKHHQFENTNRRLKESPNGILDFGKSRICISLLLLLIIFSAPSLNLQILIQNRLMAFWASILYIVNSILRSKLKIKKVFDYSSNFHFISFVKGLFIFLFTWLMLLFVSRYWVGYRIQFLNLDYFIFTFYTFFALNTIFLYFESKLNSFLRGISFYLITFLILILLSFLMIDYNKSSQILLFAALTIISLLNPTMYRKKIHPLSITWFNFFLISFLFIWQ